MPYENSPSDEPRWLTLETVLRAHGRMLELHGGLSGVRDEAMLHSALARPRNRFAHEGSDLAGLASAYAFGIARNHPFVDGNKRTSFLAMFVFLADNGVCFVAEQQAVVLTLWALAAGTIGEEELTSWIREHGRSQS